MDSPPVEPNKHVCSQNSMHTWQIKQSNAYIEFFPTYLYFLVLLLLYKSNILHFTLALTFAFQQKFWPNKPWYHFERNRHMHFSSTEIIKKSKAKCCGPIFTHLYFIHYLLPYCNWLLHFPSKPTFTFYLLQNNSTQEALNQVFHLFDGGTYSFGIEQFLQRICDSLNSCVSNFSHAEVALHAWRLFAICQGPRSFLTSASNQAFTKPLHEPRMWKEERRKNYGVRLNRENNISKHPH